MIIIQPHCFVCWSFQWKKLSIQVLQTRKWLMQNVNRLIIEQNRTECIMAPCSPLGPTLQDTFCRVVAQPKIDVIMDGIAYCYPAMTSVGFWWNNRWTIIVNVHVFRQENVDRCWMQKLNWSSYWITRIDRGKHFFFYHFCKLCLLLIHSVSSLLCLFEDYMRRQRLHVKGFRQIVLTFVSHKLCHFSRNIFLTFKAICWLMKIWSSTTIKMHL